MSADLAGLQNGSDLQFIEMQSRSQGTGQSALGCSVYPWSRVGHGLLDTGELFCHLGAK